MIISDLNHLEVEKTAEISGGSSVLTERGILTISRVRNTAEAIATADAIGGSKNSTIAASSTLTTENGSSAVAVSGSSTEGLVFSFTNL